MNLKKSVVAALVATVVTAGSAAAQPLNSFITFNGLDWAWASPCRSYSPSCANDVLSVNPGGLWRYATAAEWAAHPLYEDFVDPLGNSLGAQNGVRIRCASAYFGSGYSHCDDGNFRFNSGYAYEINSGPNGSTESFAEAFVVRDSVVPEPASLVLLATGLLGVAGVARRRKI